MTWQPEAQIKIALQYPPRVRAFAGALLDEINSVEPVLALKKSLLNPITTKLAMK